MSLSGIFTLILIVLKKVGIINLSWFAVYIPMGIGILMMLLFVITEIYKENKGVN